jgi:hypothetical protein
MAPKPSACKACCCSEWLPGHAHTLLHTRLARRKIRQPVSNLALERDGTRHRLSLGRSRNIDRQFPPVPLCCGGRSGSLIIMPSTGVIPAMPVEGIIDPARARTIRRPPKRPSPERAYNTADHSTGRPGDHKSAPGTECCTNSIGFRTCRSSDHQENWCGCQ